jgi:hypothetical protein
VLYSPETSDCFGCEALPVKKKKYIIAKTANPHTALLNSFMIPPLISSSKNETLQSAISFSAKRFFYLALFQI